ncbi:hypothetical protein Ocin01_16713 [Orchesella cincta]|uniref:Uncharacterized protein n=1 Tax=Orchesella cincta TaxID=48709 RepID=A0A1D2MAS5_ORCCI|nr:hypothetical protein Ocin01_16713 [Orchesella cincta]
MNRRGRSGRGPSPHQSGRVSTDTSNMNPGFPNPAAVHGSSMYRQLGPRSPASERHPGNALPYQWQMQAVPQQVPQQMPPFLGYGNREQVDPFRSLGFALPSGPANPSAMVQMNSRHGQRPTQDRNFASPPVPLHSRYATQNVGHSAISTVQRQAHGGSMVPYETENRQASQSYGQYFNPANFYGQQQYQSYPTEHPGYFTNQYAGRLPRTPNPYAAPTSNYQRSAPTPGPFVNSSANNNPPYYPVSSTFHQALVTSSHSAPSPPQILPPVPALSVVPVAPVVAKSPQTPRQLGFSGAPSSRPNTDVAPEIIDLGLDVSDNEDNTSRGGAVDNGQESRAIEETGGEKSKDEDNAQSKTTGSSAAASDSEYTDEVASEYESSSDSSDMMARKQIILEKILREGGLKRHLDEDSSNDTAPDQLVIKSFRLCDRVYSSCSDPDIENEHDENLRKKLKSCQQYESGGLFFQLSKNWQDPHGASEDGFIVDVSAESNESSLSGQPEYTTNSAVVADVDVRNQAAVMSSEIVNQIENLDIQMNEDEDGSKKVSCGSYASEDNQEAPQEIIQAPPELANPEPVIAESIDHTTIKQVEGTEMVLDEIKMENDVSLKTEDIQTTMKCTIKRESEGDSDSETRIAGNTTAFKEVKVEPGVNDVKIELHDEYEEDSLSDSISSGFNNDGRMGRVDAETPEYTSSSNDSFDDQPSADERLENFISELKRKGMLDDPSGPFPYFVLGLLRQYTIPQRLPNLKQCEMKIVGVPKLAGRFRAALCRELEISEAEGIGLHSKEEVVSIIEDYSRKMKYMIYLMDCESDETFDIEEFLRHAMLLKPLIEAQKVDFLICKSQDGDGPNIDNSGWRKLTQITGCRFTAFFYDVNNPATFNVQINACKNKYLRLAIMP